MIKRLCSLLRMTQPSVSDPGMLYAHGAAVPTDGNAGYATGCVFAHTDGGAATALYVNEGDVDECDFNAVTGTINDIGFEDLDDLTLEDYTAGNIIVADGTGFAEVAVSGDITLAANGAATLNDAHAEQTAYIPVAALEAGNDLSTVLVWSHPRACTLVSLGFFATGSFGTVDNSNTAVFDVTDGAANAIVSKTYNTTTQPSATAINDFGALDVTNKVLTAGEGIKLAITNGGTAATPAGLLVVRYIPTNA